MFYICATKLACKASKHLELTLFTMEKRYITISFLLILCLLGTAAQAQNSSWNYTTLDSKGLEERMVFNIHAGNPVYKDVFLALTFTVEDFGKLKKSFNSLGRLKCSDSDHRDCFRWKSICINSRVSERNI